MNVSFLTVQLGVFIVAHCSLAYLIYFGREDSVKSLCCLRRRSDIVLKSQPSGNLNSKCTSIDRRSHPEPLSRLRWLQKTLERHIILRPRYDSVPRLSVTTYIRSREWILKKPHSRSHENITCSYHQKNASGIRSYPSLQFVCVRRSKNNTIRKLD